MFGQLNDLYSLATFSHVTPIVRIGRDRVLLESDVPPLPDEVDPKFSEPGFFHLPLGSPWRFLFQILCILKRDVTWSLVLTLFRIALALASPLLIYALLGRLSDRVQLANELPQALGLAVALCAAGVGTAVLTQHYYYRALKSEQKIVNGLNVRIFRHALGLSRVAKLNSSTGDVVNHMSSDTDAVQEVFMLCVEIFYSVVISVLVVAMLFHFLGVAALAAVGVLALMTPLTRFLGKRFAHLDDELMTHRDARVSMMSQLLSGIRVVKFFGWGRQSVRDVTVVRERELGTRKRMVYSEALATLLYVSTSTLVCFTAFATHILLGHALDAPTVFACLALFGLLEEPFGHITDQLAMLTMAKVSAGRIIGFLKKESLAPAFEADPDAHTEERTDVPAELVFQNVCVRYADANQDVLTDFNLNIKPGESVAFVGPVGSGKTSLLLACLREAPVTSGVLSVAGVHSSLHPRTAFVPQEAFILNASLRANIDFGADADQNAMQVALTAANLQHDLALLPFGLDTEIGEHGVNLSGGQKQRVSLARACLRKPGLVLLDDPFSAVDFATEDALADDLLFGHWRQITRLVVTHRLAHLERFDRVVFVCAGRIEAQGTLASLLAQSKTFQRFYASALAVPQQEKSLDGGFAPLVPLDTRRTQADTSVAPTSEPSSGAVEPLETHSEGGRITGDEDKEVGAVKGHVYLTYFKALGGENLKRAPWIVGALVLSTALASLAPLAQNAWLSVWTDTSLRSPAGINKHLEAVSGLVPYLARWVGSDLRNLTIFGVLGLGVLGAFLWQRILWRTRTLVASRDMHKNALTGVLNAPLRFFDANPQGRILNRFARDVDAIDRYLPWALESTVQSIVQIFVASVLMVAVLPWSILGFAPALLIFYKLQRDYRRVAREVKRFDSVTRSPRYALFKETLQGLVVIRSFRQSELFVERFVSALAVNQKMFHGVVLLNRWFSLRVPVLSGLISLAVCLGVVVAAANGSLATGMAGLLLSYALSFWGALNWGVRSFSDLESKMTAVERVLNFTQIAPEPDVSASGSGPANVPERWPFVGEVTFDNVTVRYAPHLPLVLKGVSFVIKPGSKVGIAGRTGSGKSTLFQTLFRFIELECGQIRIDGLDIARVPLDRLRTSLAIIPQDPTLFSGTLRLNLDRFGAYSDQEIWQALGRAHLKDFVESLEGGLEAKVQENGHNFSQGQRQLFCLARALLCRARIIVLDEATASVDIQTDALIQDTLREQCVNVTVIIIAHRLETLAECDQVIELADGRVVGEKMMSSKAGVSTPKNIPDFDFKSRESVRSLESVKAYERN